MNQLYIVFAYIQHCTTLLVIKPSKLDSLKAIFQDIIILNYLLNKKIL